MGSAGSSLLMLFLTSQALGAASASSLSKETTTAGLRAALSALRSFCYLVTILKVKTAFILSDSDYKFILVILNIMRVFVKSMFVFITAGVSGLEKVDAAACCYSKWGDPKTGCGMYPASGHGGLCNTDWTEKCPGAKPCPTNPVPPTC